MQKTLTINDHSVSIPWSGVDKYMLMAQHGFHNGLFVESDILKVIENRLILRINDLFPILETLEPNSNILDLGAGNGILNLIIHKLFPHKNFRFLLVDGDNSYPSKTGNQFYSADFKPYNNWNFVQHSIEINQFPKENFVFKNLDSNWSENTVALATSSSAWGFHFPIDLYLDKIANMMSPTGFLYINPVLNTDQAFDKLEKTFSNILLNREITYEMFTILGNSERNRMNKLLGEKTLDGTHVAFVILAQK